MKKRILALILMVAMLIMIMPTGAFAAEAEAKIGTTEFDTLDEALEAAKEEDIIEVLKDANISGLNLDKNLTISGSTANKPTVTFNDKGIALWGKSLTFKNLNVMMNGVGATQQAEWNWMTICATKGASLTLDNVTMTLDGSGTTNKHAIYFCSNNKLNICNGSKLTIKNYAQDALEWNGGDGGYNVNITDSTFISDKNRSGFTGTFVAVIKNSRVDVINSTGNGSNGSHFDIEDSIVNFNNNTGHGLSAGNLIIDNSTITCNNNGANAINAAGILTIKNKSDVTVKLNRCSISSKWTIPAAVYVGNAVGDGSSIDSTSKVTIEDNLGSGILVKTGVLAVEEGVNLSIMRNKADKLELGGGVHIMQGGAVYLPEGIKLYNNHAAKAGDDIYAEPDAVVVFPKVGNKWELDGEPDCTEKITGWFDDSENARWDTHSDNPSNYHYALTEAGEYRAQDVPIALKAAHGLISIDVNKEWKIDNGGKIADKVEIILLKNGDKYAAAELSKENNWAHTFENLNDSAEWSVMERAVEDFTATIKKADSNTGIMFTITNDDKPAPKDEESSEDKDAKDTPPKTGDESSLILFMGIMLAAVLSAAGVAVYKKRFSLKK